MLLTRHRGSVLHRTTRTNTTALCTPLRISTQPQLPRLGGLNLPSLQSQQQQYRTRHVAKVLQDLDDIEEEEAPQEELSPLQKYLADLQQKHGIPGFVDFVEGTYGLPTVRLSHPNGQVAEVSLYGACITRWTMPSGLPALYYNEDFDYSNGGPVGGAGVPVVFPQFRHGQLPENGFANRMLWEVVDTDLDFDFVEPPKEVLTTQEEYDQMQQLLRERAAQLEQQEEEEGEAAAAAGGYDDDDELLVPQQVSAQQLLDRLEAGEEEMGEEFDDMLTPADPAPCVVLRLRDTPETRELWPHAFELLYKITLMEDDSLEEEAAGPDPGIDPHVMSMRADSIEGAERYAQIFTEGEDGSVRRSAEADAAAGGAAGEVDETNEGEGLVPLQLKMEMLLINNDPDGAPPLTFHAGLLPHFATLDMARYPEFVKALGLGGGMVLDYSRDSRQAVLRPCDADYLHFANRDNLDITFINIDDATVKLCPGNRSHWEFVTSGGFRDYAAAHPGVSLQQGEEHTRGACMLGVGRLALAKKLPPGETWEAGLTLRHHARYWTRPIWDRAEAQPMPPIDDIELRRGGEVDEYAGVGQDEGGDGEE